MPVFDQGSIIAIVVAVVSSIVSIFVTVLSNKSSEKIKFHELRNQMKKETYFDFINHLESMYHGSYIDRDGRNRLISFMITSIEKFRVVGSNEVCTAFLDFDDKLRHCINIDPKTPDFSSAEEEYHAAYMALLKKMRKDLSIDIKS